MGATAAPAARRASESPVLPDGLRGLRCSLAFRLALGQGLSVLAAMLGVWVVAYGAAGIPPLLLGGGVAAALIVTGIGALVVHRSMADRLETMRHAAAIVAHDLRTPLARVRTRLDHGLRRNDPDRLAEEARGALHDIDLLIDLFEKLLQIAEAESGGRQRYFANVSLAGVLSEVAEMFAGAASGREVRLTCEIAGDVVVPGDRALLSALVINLVDNALKYAAGPGGAVTLSLHGAAGRWAEMRVEDNGPGIPAAARERVFQRFFRLERGRAQPGHGLGLTLAAAIAALHGGRILLEDAGPGLCARVLLSKSADRGDAGYSDPA